MSKLFFPWLICFVSAGPLWAEESRSVVLDYPQKWDFKGVIRTEFRMYQKPSGIAGNSEFHIPYADVEGLGDVLKNVQVDFEISHASPVAGSAGNPLNIQRLAVKFFPESLHHVEFSIGLIEPAFSPLQKQDWVYDNLTPDLFWPAARWGYWNASDYGFQLSQKEENFSWGLGILNGEGAMKSSQRAQKDVFVWGDFKFASSQERQNHVLIHALRGAYDNVPTTDASKDRFNISLWTRAERGLSLGAEYWSLRDPADAISLKAADAVDLSAFGGKRVKGQILSSHGGYRFGRDNGEQYEVFYRSDRVDPVISDSSLNLTADHFGFGYSPQPGLDWIFLFSDIAYADGHSLSARDQQLWRLSFNVTWD